MMAAVAYGRGASWVVGALLALLAASTLPPRAATAAAGARAVVDTARVYRVFVANEASDLVSLVRFAPGRGAALERDIEVGVMPADLDGPHGVRVSPDGAALYVTLAHGTPYGALWSLDPVSGRRLGAARLGLFPATIGVTPDGELGFVVNFNLHGPPTPSSVSAVLLPELREIRRIETCAMPHGSRVGPDGRSAWSVCMGDDRLVEISVADLAVARRMDLTPGAEGPLPPAGSGGSDPHAAGTGRADAPRDAPRCGPTWVWPAPDGRRVYVACNRRGEVLEVDVATLRVGRRLGAGAGVYNLAGTSDGRLLLATNKGEQSVSVFDLARGEERARIATTRPVTHGVVVSADDRYAFVSNEAVGATPGTVDVIDLEALERVASAEVHLQPGGIDLWRNAAGEAAPGSADGGTTEGGRPGGGP